MTARILPLLVLALARPASAQSIIFPSLLDRHIPHLITKPIVTLGAYAALGTIQVPNTTRTVLAIVGPSLIADVVWEFKDPGHLTDGHTVKDNIQDSFAASLSMIVLRMHGWARIVAVALWGTVEFGLGLSKWGEP